MIVQNALALYYLAREAQALSWALCSASADRLRLGGSLAPVTLQVTGVTLQVTCHVAGYMSRCRLQVSRCGLHVTLQVTCHVAGSIGGSLALTGGVGGSDFGGGGRLRLLFAI